jgi:hypothetical protein
MDKRFSRGTKLKRRKMDGLIEGRKVHYVMPNGQHRPATIVKVWGETGCSNLQVQTDGSNDAGYTQADVDRLKAFGISPDEVRHGHIWVTNIQYSDEMKQGTWHWIERA